MNFSRDEDEDRIVYENSEAIERLKSRHVEEHKERLLRSSGENGSPLSFTASLAERMKPQSSPWLENLRKSSSTIEVTPRKKDLIFTSPRSTRSEPRKRHRSRLYLEAGEDVINDNIEIESSSDDIEQKKRKKWNKTWLSMLQDGVKKDMENGTIHPDVPTQVHFARKRRNQTGELVSRYLALRTIEKDRLERLKLFLSGPTTASQSSEKIVVVVNSIRREYGVTICKSRILYSNSSPFNAGEWITVMIKKSSSGEEVNLVAEEKTTLSIHPPWHLIENSKSKNRILLCSGIVSNDDTEIPTGRTAEQHEGNNLE